MRTHLPRTLIPMLTPSVIPARLTIAAFAFGMFACSGSDPVSPPIATSLSATAATALLGVAGGSTLEAPSVIVRDQRGEPMPGVTVSFAVTGGGGYVSDPTAVTSAAGVAITGWTLGTSTGLNTLVVSSGGLPSVTFTATSTSGIPVSADIAGGNGQTATVRSELPVVPSVAVRDMHGNPVSGVLVTFTVKTGGGSVSGGSQRTNSAGVAASGPWILGATAGTNTLTATAATAGTLTPIVFVATGLAGPAAMLTKAGGDNQLVVAGSAVPTPPSIIVRDAYANLIAGAVVTFTVASGGGSVAGATVTTATSGIATVGSWTTGSAPGGINTLTASSPGLIPVTFTAATLCVTSTEHTIGSASSGTLSSSDCPSGGGGPADYYSTTVITAGAYMFRETSSSFDAQLYLLTPDGTELAMNNDSASITTNSAIKIILPPNNYLLVAGSLLASATGAYTFSSSSTNADVSGCATVFVVRGITTAQSVSTLDCVTEDDYYYYSYSYRDEYVIYLPRGQSLTVTMTSTALSSDLVLLNSSGSSLAYRTATSTPSQDASLSFTATTDGYYRIIAGTRGSGQTGAYTLKVQ